METLVVKSLGKLRKACTRSHRELRDMVDAAQAKVTAAGQEGTLEVPFEPFLLACLTRHAKLVAVALDCMEKFLAFGFLKEAGVIPEGIRRRLVQKAAAPSARKTGFGLGLGSGGSGHVSGSGSSAAPSFGLTTPSSNRDNAEEEGNEDNYRLIDCIVEVACDCNDHPDEGVQIQVLRVLLTAVTTPTCEVHEHALLRAVRACYHVHLVSKSATNRTVAKATLQQIISIVFQRMETFDRRVEEETKAALQSMEKQEQESQQAEQEQQQTQEQHEISESDSDEEILGHTLRAGPTTAFYPSVAAILQLPQPPSQKTISSAMTKKVKAVATLSQPMNAPAFPSVLHKDAFLLFRSLCRISMRSVADDSPTANGANGSAPGNTGNGANPEDPFAFQSKILSLELVKEILENAGPSFRRGERFVHAIRQYLCQSLLQNCTSNYTQIVSLSLQVFLVLLRNFKRHLKTELDIFITSIFLRLLQSEHASFEHKLLVLEALHAICDDPQTLGEIFINYDCDWNTNDLFKQIVHALAKAAKGGRSQDAAAQQYVASLSSSARIKMQQQDAALALKGLECLTATTASLKKAANFVEIERQASQHEGEDLHNIENGGEEDTVAPPDLAPVVSATMSAVEAFESKKKRQEEMATGILKFNVKPSAGIAYLVAHGHMGEGSPRDVAQFLQSYNDKLDKTMVGDYLGNGVHYQGGFCVKVLHEYVDMMDFTDRRGHSSLSRWFPLQSGGLEIDVAIRHFLAGFRLPGESQKIDRMMEKFAERFFNSCPPGLFPSADTAFILAFSIIMLQTDLHNPSIAEEKKMDKSGFLRNNRGINDGKDLPEDYMGAIFDRIKATPISLKEDDDFRSRRGGTVQSTTSSLFGASNATTDRLRRDAYIKERESMVRQSEALFKRRVPASARTQPQFPSPRGNRSMTAPTSGSSPSKRSSDGPSSLLTPDPLSSTFREVSGFNERSHVRPMFETLWAPLLAACSVTFESSESAEAIQLCLDSFRHAVHLSARLGMPAERDAFVTVLAKFTALHTTNSRLMRSKNMEAIKALISISVKEGNYLGDSWHDVLQAISQLARIQTHAQGLHERSAAGSVSGDSSYFNRQPSPALSSHSSSRNSSANSTPSFSMLGSSTSSKRGGLGSSLSSPSPSHRDISGRGSGSELDEAQSAAIEDENAARVLSEIDQLASDRVFSSSASLSDQALQDFVVQLTVVSLSECSGVGPSGATGGSPPRVFSLQKLVEVADMNMRTRSRMVWAATWQTLSRHFTTIGCHEDLTVGMYAIDSLRQLSMKFLERAELRDFNFQRLFLAPFEVIMSNATSLETRELVLRCVENLVLARVGNIRSGWKTIWGVLRVAAETYAPGSEDRVVLLGFQVARGVLERHFDCIVDFAAVRRLSGEDRVVLLGFQVARGVLERHFDCIVDVFVDAVECLLAFAVCGCEEVERQMDERLALTQLGVDSIGLLRSVCTEKLATGEVIEPLTARETAGSLSATSAPAAAAAAAAAAKQAARVGFKKIKVVSEDPTGEASSEDGPGVHSPSKRASVRYQKQESVRSLEEEVAELSPRKTLSYVSSPRSPRRRAGSVESQEEEHENSEAAYNDSAAHTRMWWPVLTALSTLAADRRLDVRLAALEALFDALETHGQKFSSGLWGLIFKGVLIPLLDELRHLEVVVEKGAHMLPKLPLPPTRNPSTSMPQYTAGKTTATLCLERLLECFGLFYDIVGFLPEVLFLLGKCMDAGDAEEQLAAASARALEVMLVSHGHKFPEDVWGLISDELRNVMKRAEPTWIFFAMPPEDEVESLPMPGSPVETGAESPSKSGESPTKKAISLPPPSPFGITNLTSPRQPSLLSMYPGVVEPAHAWIPD
ncbi:LOW QUALITY PROTEIN: Brefeldin A-inhibited guanine nucleotide-exchange protein [Phytophthora megakarya]|uniref:Brefeldin A-inhibited guanine nucleotide-exchange protein n=1 Tax=Phytophthora megakarya TaxID=4795 RepID=A0A225VZD2_9STRA|nr:LOW QUALITY PROTEIN: Brefeldin A-inhibited guanine nucleotide-exchange protein [Phytophthora megakarya]